MWVCLSLFSIEENKQDQMGHNMVQWNLWELAERSALHFIFFFFFWFRSGTCCLFMAEEDERVTPLLQMHSFNLS